MASWKETLRRAGSSDWIEEPVDFVTFVTSPEFLFKDPELSPIQLEEALRVVGPDPKKMFSKERDINLYVWLWGKGCLAENVLITDIMTGERKTVKDWAFENRRFTVWAWDETTGKLITVKAQTPYSKGLAEVFRIVANNSFIEVSGEHKFYAKDRGWVELNELEVGDEILYSDFISRPDSYSDVIEGACRYVKIKEIKPLGQREIFDFEVPIYHTYLLYGFINHNSGKGTVASILYLYALYVLSCMRSPQKYFGTAPSDEFSLVNVATTYDQAKDVVFNRLQNRFKKVKWFRDRFKLVQSGKVVGGNPASVDVIELRPGSGEIRILRPNIVAKCLHAQSESWEGKNLIFWVMDEACLAEDTLIIDEETAESHTIKEWCLLQKGFTIKAFNTQKKEVIRAKAKPPFYKGNTRLYEVTICNATFKVSANHKFYTKKGWKELKKLRVDDLVLIHAPYSEIVTEVPYEKYCENCFWVPITSIKYIGEGEIYDFEVPRYHNYFLNGVLHHNSGFKSEKKLANAGEILATLQTSTRELPYIGIITSYPRLPREFDFTCRLYDAIMRGEIKGYASLRLPWETRPNSFSGEYFDFLIDTQGTVVRVPKEYEEYFKKDPEDAKRKYLCMPPSVVEDSFFEYLSDFGELISDREPIIKLGDRVNEYENKRYLEKVILSLQRVNYPVCISIDAGEKHSDSALTIAHVENDKVIIDAILVWRPGEKLPVNINNLVDIVNQLGKFYRISRVRIDHWNAASLEQQFRKVGINVVTKNVSLEDYNILKNLIYTGLIEFPNQGESTELFYQLKALKTKGNKPRVEIGKQDIADSVAGVVGLFSRDVVKRPLPSPLLVSKPSKTLTTTNPAAALPQLLGLENPDRQPYKRRLPSPRRL